MKSMTGFGRGEYRSADLVVDVEIKTINHRYRDFNIRLPRKYSSFEEKIRNFISNKINRGRIDVFIKTEKFSGEDISLFYDDVLAKEYYDILNKIKTDFKDIKDDISVNTIARYPEVVKAQEAEVDLDEQWKYFEAALNDAVNTLVESRENEGEALKKDFIKRIEIISKESENISNLAHEIPKNYAKELNENIEKYKIGIIDSDRIATEIAIYAEKVNITEELVRLKNHLKSFLSIIEKSEPIGRKLDFLLQEINREANTIASKSNSFEISSAVVEIKSELEKIREQIQNIE
ncbi:YicC/YloC family endoribonuclease [Anaerofustis sp.]|uniref:YicC/YloC family endoribonuclease n=1 Tax=Anaerofustis sp. TaxID=1872517 RepID=UPI0025BCB1A5|nr:YicC/YloC family endoribonuclease [Anaerofustis sp.]